MDEKKRLHYLSTRGLTRYTEHTITGINKYLQEINAVKKRGFALDRDEYIPGVRAVISIIDTDTHSLAAIWVVGFSSSLTDIKMQEADR